MLCLGGMISALFYISVTKSSGIDGLLERTGTSKSSWMSKAQSLADSYGFIGLVMANATPCPSAIVVVAGVLAKIPERKILAAIFFSRFVVQSLTAFVLKKTLGDTTPEEYIQELFG